MIRILYWSQKNFCSGPGDLGVWWTSVMLLGPGSGPTHVLAKGYVPTIVPRGLTVFGQKAARSAKQSNSSGGRWGNDKVQSVPTHGRGGLALGLGHHRQEPRVPSAPRGGGFPSP